MRKRLTMFLAALLTLIFALSMTAYSAPETPLYQKYNYSETFEYEDEMIGHALKATVPKIILDYSAQLRYKPIQFDSQRLSQQFEELCAEFSGEYSEDEIAQVLIDYMRENLSDYLIYGNFRTVDVGGMGTGSGVVISEDGYVATNAHVATLDEDSKLELYMYTLSENVYEDYNNLIEEIESLGAELDYETTDYLYSLISSAVTEDAEVIHEKTKLLVCFPTSDGNTDYENAVTYEAELVKAGTQVGTEGLTKDTAILKINADNLVALPLSDTYPASNSQIVSAGFPAVAEEIFSYSGSDASTLSVSMGTGKVSRLVPIDGSNYKSIEITTTISNGNSGGPSVDKALNIEGLNTYAATSDMRFAFMISAEFISDLTSGINIHQGDTSKTFLTGLQLLQQDYGIAAKECFEYVREVQPNTPYIEELIVLAEKAPQNEYTVASAGTEASSDDKLFLYIIIGGCVLLLLIILLVIVIVRKKKKNVASTTNYGYGGPGSEASVSPMPVYKENTWDDVQPVSAPVIPQYTEPMPVTPQPAVPQNSEPMPVAPQPESGSRLKSTMGMAKPKEITPVDDHFHSPTDL